MTTGVVWIIASRLRLGAANPPNRDIQEVDSVETEASAEGAVKMKVEELRVTQSGMGWGAQTCALFLCKKRAPMPHRHAHHAHDLIRDSRRVTNRECLKKKMTCLETSTSEEFQ